MTHLWWHYLRASPVSHTAVTLALRTWESIWLAARVAPLLRWAPDSAMRYIGEVPGTAWTIPRLPLRTCRSYQTPSHGACPAPAATRWATPALDSARSGGAAVWPWARGKRCGLGVCAGRLCWGVLPEWWRKNVLCFASPLSPRSRACSPALLQHP